MAAGALLLLYTVTGFWIAPRIVASQLRKQLPPITHREVSVERVQINPFRLTLTISNLNLTEPGGGAFASLERFHANLESASLWKWTLVFSDVEVLRPQLVVERASNGVLNLANLLPPPDAASAPKTNTPLPRVQIGHLHLDGGSIALRDQAIPGGFEKTLGPVEVALTNLSTLSNVIAPGALRIASSTGERIAWDGEITVQPPATSGEIFVGPFLIPTHGPYLDLATPADVLSGSLSLRARYALTAPPGGPLDVVVTNVLVAITNLQVRLPDATETNFTVKEFTLGDMSAGWLAKDLRVGRLHLADASFAAQRGSDGTVDVEQAIRPEFIQAAIQAVNERLAGWQFELADVGLERLTLLWGDLKLGSPVRLSALIESLRVRGVSNHTNQPITLEGAARWGETGTAALSAEGTLLPPSASAQMEFSKVRLPMLQPYVEEQLNLDVRSGTVDGRWTVQYNRQAGGPLIVTEGGVSVNDFLAFDTAAGRDFLKWDGLEVRAIRGSWEPATVAIQEIHLRAPSTSFVLMTNGQLNVLGLIRTNAPAPPTPKPATAESASPARDSGPTPLPFDLQVTLGRLSLTNASLLAADETVPGKFTTTLQRFSGQITDFGWPDLKKSRVELSGWVDARAPFSVEGSVFPDLAQPQLDMHVTATNADLIPFTPYSIKFAGYPLKDGRLTADVRYQVSGRQVEGENHVVVDRLTLGAKAAGKPLLDLPIRLGIALLKDSDGRITLDVPVRGSLDDPEFGVSQVVWQAVKGLFVKAATAPFRLLGSLFGGSEEDGQSLQTVEFDAGHTDLNAQATNRLQQLVTALNKRPELLVSIRGGASPDEDGPVLARLRLDQELQQLATNTAPAADTLSAADTNRLLLQLFTNAFPVTATSPETPAAVSDPAATPPPVPPAPELTPEAMELSLLKHWAPTPADLDALRAARAAAVHAWLTADQRLVPDRALLTDPAETNAPPLTNRVAEFSLE